MNEVEQDQNKLGQRVQQRDDGQGLHMTLTDDQMLNDSNSSRKGLNSEEVKAFDDEEDQKTEEEVEITIYDIENPKYSKRNINLTYGFLFYINMSLNFDHGAMPAATKALEVGLDLNTAQLGWLGSLVFIGLFFGSVAGSFIFGKCSYKWILTVTYLGNTLGLFTFAYCTIYDFQCLARFCSGFCQVFHLIYFPVFINTIGDKSNITYLMSFFLLSGPMGVIIGYVLTAVIVNESTWQWSFYIFAINMLLLSFVMAFYSDKYINFDIMLKQFKLIKKQRDRALLYQAINPLNGEEIAPQLNQIAEAEEGLSQDTVQESDSETKKSTCAILWHLKSNLIYMMIIGSLTGLFYIVTDIQYWITLYLINNIGVSQSKAQIGFAIICITSPTAGAVSSGPITAWAGGYEHKNALRLGLFLAILSGIIAIPIPFIDNFYLLAVNLWFYLYIGGILVPLMTGTYLANVEVEYRTQSSSMANIFYEAFGFAPAPYIWGYVQNATGGNHSRWGLGSTVLMNWPPVIFLTIAVIYQNHLEKKKKQVNAEEQEVLDQFQDDKGPNQVREHLLLDGNSIGIAPNDTGSSNGEISTRKSITQRQIYGHLMFQKDKMPNSNIQNENILNYNEKEDQANSDYCLNIPASRYFSDLKVNILQSICVEPKEGEIDDNHDTVYQNDSLRRTRSSYN